MRQRMSLPTVSMLAVLLALAPGCGRTALQRAKVVGLTAKQTAESAYLTVRIEYELGHVDQATMDRARSLYARFEMAQKAYVAALELWENGAPQPDLDTLREQVTALAAALHALALEVKSERLPAAPACGRHADRPAAQAGPPTTTRPATPSTRDRQAAGPGKSRGVSTHRLHSTGAAASSRPAPLRSRLDGEGCLARSRLPRTGKGVNNV